MPLRAPPTGRLIEIWRAWSEPSPTVVDPSLRWRAQLLASLMLVAVSLTAVLITLSYVMGSMGPDLPVTLALPVMVGLGGCHALARSKHWRVGAWLAALMIAGAGLADMAMREQPYIAIFVALAITLGAMVLRKRDIGVLVGLVLAGFFTMPLWSGVHFSPTITVLLASFFMLLGLVLGMSMGLRGTIEEERLDALAKNEARFRGLLEVAFEGLVELKDGRIVELNPGFVEITGRSESELRGRELRAMLEIESTSPTREPGAAMSQRPGTKEASGTRPNGDIFYVELVTRVLTSDRGPIEYVAVRDITQRRQAQLQLSIAHRAVALGTLSAGIAHEINNPLSWMMTNLQVAQDELRRGVQGGRRNPERESLLHTLDDALQGGRRVISIVRDLKTMSREGNDQGVADVHAALDLACRIASRQIETRARLVRDYGHVPSVRGSAGRLGQVFLNLLTNAAQAIPEGKRDVNRITLRTRHRDGEVQVIIRDTGGGIPPKVMAHIFDPFYTTKGKEEGTGLGLSITRSVVDSLGGTISVESRPGDGATFTLCLPAAEHSAESETSSERAVPRTSIENPVETMPTTRVRVLIIDDEPLLGKSLRRALHEHDVVFTEDPARGIELCSESDFDVIVCDLMMPVFSGQDVYEHLRERAPELAARMIFMTGGAFTSGAQRFLKAIENPVLNKPFTPNDLRIAVKRMLAQHDAA